MASFSVKVVTVDKVIDHPNADRLSIARIGGYECVILKDQYKVGDPVIYVPEGAVVPDWILKKYGFWNEKTNIGMLAGPEGNRVHPLRLRGTYSQGIVLPILSGEDPPQSDELAGTTWIGFDIPNDSAAYAFDGGYETVQFEFGEDLAPMLGITKYEPPIPDELLGEVVDAFGFTHGYDFDSIQSLTDLFEIGEFVAVTEKIHGFNTQIGFAPGESHDGWFGSNQSIYLSSKGLASKGLAFCKNNPDGSLNSNAYIDALTAREVQIETGMFNLSAHHGGATVRLFCEIYGGQDLKYGKNKGDLGIALFGIYVGDKPGGQWLSRELVAEIAPSLGMESAPLLYVGPFDLRKIIEFRDGKDTFTGTHIREGVVIEALDPNEAHTMHGRKIGKWISPDYGSRKGGTELQ